MEKRFILAFVLSILVLYLTQSLYSPKPAPPPAPDATSGTNGLPPAQDTKALVATPVESTTPQNPVSQGASNQKIHADKPQEFTVDMPLYVATFWNVGGVLKSFRLKNYPDGQGGPVELINQESGEKIGWPLAQVTGDKGIDDQLHAAKFAARTEPNAVVMEFASNGLHALKAVQLDPDNYAFTFKSSVSKDGKAYPHAVVWQGDFGDQSIPQDPARKSALYQSNANFKKEALSGLKEETKEFTTLRAGVEDQYFAAVFLSAEQPLTVKVRKQDYAGKDAKQVPTLFVAVSLPEEKPVRVFIGPKQQQWLEKADPQLSGLLNYGMFGFIAKPLVAALLWMNKYIGNFGWSIIALTVVINLIIFPLRLKQQVSMLKMQKIQPQMRRLQDQYKKLKATDPRRAQVQSEMMGLYKEHGVNPMGGCLPLLLQMPLLFAFYSALAYSIELRRAPWIFWIKDLSQYDPYYVIPILMAVAMIAQQKLTPQPSTDPVQARMMMIMPVMMTFLFLWYSSGLALYWLTGSVVGLVQQVFINKYWSPNAQAKLNARGA